MSDITLTAAQVSEVNEFEGEKWTPVAGEAITKGQAVAIDTSTGKAYLADASTSARNNFRGVALKDAAAGKPVTIGVHTSVYGFDLSGLSWDAAIYLSNTAGAFATTAGDVSVVCGRVKPMGELGTQSKVFYVNAPAIM